MNSLVINTANDELYMVLQKQDKIFYKQGETTSKHNETMIPMLEGLLKDGELTIQDINQFGVVIGPGSFTGIRVGISTIKAFRDVLNVPAKGINNLKLLFALASSQNKEIETVAILGSRNSYFVAKKMGEVLYIYERNLSYEELVAVAEGKPIGMFKADENLNCFVVSNDANIMLKCLNESTDETLVPVYYQLSQAETEKLKNGELEICEAQEQDIEKCAEIEFNSMQTNALTKEEFEKALTNKSYKLYVAKFNGSVVGFIYLQITDELCVMGVAVNKEMRNFGVATKLFHKSFEFGKELKINQISLEVSEKNLTASLLYQKLGFSSRRIRKNYYADGSNAVEMFKKIE